jgi:HSP20 family protein
MYFEFQQNVRRGATWAPTVDVCERPSEIVILVEVPGVERSDIRLSWNEGVLTITGQKRQHPPDRGVAQYLCVERAYGYFRRDIAVHVPIDHTHARAVLENGLMSIHLPKKAPKSDSSTIPIF